MSEFNNNETISSTRRKNREIAIKFLYMWHINKDTKLNIFFDNFVSKYDDNYLKFNFAITLINGVIEKLIEIDKKIEFLTKNWSFERIAYIDLAILRVAIYELIYCKDIPPIVSINEALDISKIFSNENSNKFINGILDKLNKTLMN